MPNKVDISCYGLMTRLSNIELNLLSEYIYYQKHECMSAYAIRINPLCLGEYLSKYYI